MSTNACSEIFSSSVYDGLLILYVSVTIELRSNYSQSSDREYTDMERRIFWECLKMETRYRVEISLPDTGLAGINLLAERFSTTGNV